MNIIYVLIPLSILLMLLAIGAFFWAVRNDQFEDLDTPALDILDEDDEPAGGKGVARETRGNESTEDQNPENAKTRRREAKQD